MNELHLSFLFQSGVGVGDHYTYWIPMDSARDWCHGAQADIFV